MRMILQQILLLFSLVVLPAGVLLAAQQVFKAELSGAKEIPRVKTPATGTLMLRVSDQVVSFQLKVSGLGNPAAANIHRGKKGENGPVVAALFLGPPKVGIFNGVLAGGQLTEANLVGELQGKRVVDLIRLIRSGQAYVNVVTATFPAGEIRGQIGESAAAPLTRLEAPVRLQAGSRM